jgi:hypothetical protein
VVGFCDHDNKPLCFIKYGEELIDKNLNLLHYPVRIVTLLEGEGNVMCKTLCYIRNENL